MTLLYPQLLTGAVGQFPLRKSYVVSGVTNLQEDGSRYTASGTDPAVISWWLTYSHLTELEATLLANFFNKTSGRLLPFTFLDPQNNLLQWSEDFTQPVWLKSPLTSVSMIENAGIQITQLGTGSVSQTLFCLDSAQLCLSVFARADQPCSLSLEIGGDTRQFATGANWRQFCFSRFGNSNTPTTSISITVDNASAQISRVMLAAQPGPSAYLATENASGVMPNTRFDQDTLALTSNGVNDVACEVRLVSNAN